MSKLNIENLEMCYGQKRVLESISFEVHDGEFLSILGPSGCGKTTLLRILVGLLKPTAGRVYKDGKNITEASPSERGMGMVFQNYALFENMSVLKNVEYAQRIRRENKSRQARQMLHERTLELLQQLGLGEYADSRPQELSGGQQQRVAIARTLMMNPDIILFDEPMSALDVETRLSLRQELKRIQSESGTTMIYITHDQEEAFSLSDRIVVMEQAHIVQLDTPENILKHPANDYVRTFVLQNLKLKVDSLKKFAELSWET